MTPRPRKPRPTKPRRAVFFALAIALSAIAGCRYERIVSARTPFEGLPGANTPTVEKGNLDPQPAARPVVESGPIRTTLDDGTVVLVARNPRDVMRHVFETLSNEEPDLFVGQVLAERTKRRFYEEGFPPEEAYHRLRNRFTDIRALFSRIPEGDLSPNARFDVIGQNLFRLSVKGRARRDLSWTSMDLVIENRSWRLVWFGAR